MLASAVASSMATAIAASSIATASLTSARVYDLTIPADDGHGGSDTRPVRVTVSASPQLTVGIQDSFVAEGQSGTTPL